MHGIRPEWHSHVQVTFFILYYALYFHTVDIPMFISYYVTVHALHTQYIARTDPSSSGAAFHAAQVHPDDLKLL